MFINRQRQHILYSPEGLIAELSFFLTLINRFLVGHLIIHITHMEETWDTFYSSPLDWIFQEQREISCRRTQLLTLGELSNIHWSTLTDRLHNTEGPYLSSRTHSYAEGTKGQSPAFLVKGYWISLLLLTLALRAWKDSSSHYLRHSSGLRWTTDSVRQNHMSKKFLSLSAWLK